MSSNTNIFIKMMAHTFGRIIPDKPFLSIRYLMTFHKRINWRNPTTFNEKLQWLKINDREQLYSKLVDKYEVKQFVANLIGEEHIIPTLGVWDKFEDIDFDELPEQFVLKCTHDSGSVLICKQKSQFDYKAARKHFHNCLKQMAYYAGREWAYKFVKPRIIAEKYMTDELGTDLKDYKFFCFNGVAKCLKVDINRFVDHHANYYDTEMVQLPFGEVLFPPDYSFKIERPAKLDVMISLAEILSAGHAFLRVDLYNINGDIYFGELTFFPACGFEEFIPEEWDYVLGNWIILPVGASNDTDIR